MLLGALSIAAALLAASCSSSSPGPLGLGGTGSACVPYREGAPVTFGLFDLHNSGSSPVTVQSLRLPAANGLRMTSAWLVPFYFDKKDGNTDTIGVGWAYPPATRPEWPQRRPAIGAVIKPGQDLNLVFGLIRTTPRNGTSDGPAIVYTSNGNTYTMQEGINLTVSPDCDAPTPGTGPTAA